MPSNIRVYYGCYALGIAPFETAPSSYDAVRGLQSAGLNTSFNLDPTFEIGQLDVYENIEGLPDVELTLEKVLDGYCPAYLLATEGAPAATLVGRSNQRANVALSIFQDTGGIGSGTPLSQVICSGMYVSQVGYNLTNEGNATESLTLVGNNKVRATGSFVFSGFTAAHGVTSLSPAAAQGVNRRQDILMTGCLWPTQIPGISSSGTNDPVTNSGFAAHIQSVRVSASLGREQLTELGTKAPFFRYINFPVDVNTSIEVLSSLDDGMVGTEAGVLGDGDNLSNQTILVRMREGLTLDLGTKNKLASVNWGGANAGRGGGNATSTYNYSNQNILTVQHTGDVTVALRP